MTADDGLGHLRRAKPEKADPTARELRADAPARRRHGLRREPTVDAPWNLHVLSASAVIPAGLVKDSPTLLVLAVEDACWQFALADHAGRRPPWYHRRARKLWKAELAVLDAKRLRLLEMAREETPDL